MTELRPPFHMELQQQDNWCWAAVAASVNNWAGRTRVTQCEVAVLLRGQGPCQNPASFDLPNKLQDAFAALQIANDPHAGQTTAFNFIQSEIDRNRPICARILWDKDGDLEAENAHFVVIGGYQAVGEDEVIKVFDSAGTGAARVSSVHYSRFLRNYNDVGVWKDTYFLGV